MRFVHSLLIMLYSLVQFGCLIWLPMITMLSQQFDLAVQNIHGLNRKVEIPPTALYSLLVICYKVWLKRFFLGLTRCQIDSPVCTQTTDSTVQ